MPHLLVQCSNYADTALWVYFLAKRNAVSRACETFLSDTRPDRSVEILGVSGVMEFKGAFDLICDKERIPHRKVPPNSPQLTVVQK